MPVSTRVMLDRLWSWRVLSVATTVVVAILLSACEPDASSQSDPTTIVPAATIVVPTSTNAVVAETPSATSTALPPTSTQMPLSVPSPVPVPATPSPVDPTAPPSDLPTPTATSLPAQVHLTPSATPTVTESSVFTPPLPEPFIAAPPDRDLQHLGRRLVAGYTEPLSVVDAAPLKIGDQVDFWVSRDGGSVKTTGEVSFVSENAYWVFELGHQPQFDDIAEVAANFESDVWPAVTGVFGTPLTPGIDGDPKIVVFNAILRSGVAGYFSSADSYPQQIRTHSNQREALYMSADRVDLTSSEYLSVIAHELQHATHFAADSSEDSWVNEGLSEIAAEIAGFARSAASQFVRAPATSLTAWAQDISVSAANYGAANLFFAFLASHYGGNDIIAAVANHPEDGIKSIDLALAELGFDATANDVYADWLVANYLSTDEGPYAYTDHYVPPVRNIYKRAPDSVTGSVRAFGSDYLVTSSGSGQMTVEFEGEPETPLLTEPPHSGDTCWWSNHGDSIDSTLTRSIDLSEVDSATLSFWVNYDIEEFWDYAYVMVSTNNGGTWDILDTNRALNFNPNGTAYGAGLTGTSLGWVQDSVDLSDYTGQIVLLRFEYITDDAVFSKGACFDDFEIPEIDWFDDTSTEDGWTVDGFARVEQTVPTQYLVQVIHEKKIGDPDVYRMPVGADGKGTLTVDGVGDDDLVVAVISAVTRSSTTPTDYTLNIYP